MSGRYTVSHGRHPVISEDDYHDAILTWNTRMTDPERKRATQRCARAGHQWRIIPWGLIDHPDRPGYQRPLPPRGPRTLVCLLCLARREADDLHA